MTDKPIPVVYILHGEDEFGMAGFVLTMQDKLGDATTADMNITRLEGKANLDLEALRAAASAMPFLAPRRMVVVENPISRLKSQPQRDKLKTIMDSLPPTTALVLVEGKMLKQSHWLLKWASQS